MVEVLQRVILFCFGGIHSILLMALIDMKNYRRVIPSTGGVGLREDANRSSSSADVDGDFQDAMEKEDSRCICSKSKAISAGSQDLDTTDIIRTLQRTSSNSKSSLHISSQQQHRHRQEEDTSCCANSITPTFSFSSPSREEIIATKTKYKHSNSSGSSPMTAITKTSLTTASSSTTSSGTSNVGSRHNESYPDEILARNTIISFEKKSNKNVKSASPCPSIPFFDYLEEQVSKLIEKNESAPKCCVATISPRRNCITHHPELSPISSQSVAVAEAKNIRRLRREVLGLYRTLDTLKKDSREWMLLKSKLDDAKEELDAVLEDQKLVRSIETVKTW